MAKADSFLSISPYGKAAVSIVSALLLLPFAILQPFCNFTCRHLMGVLGTSTLVTARDRMQMWRRYHQLTINPNMIGQFQLLMDNLPPDVRHGKAECLLLQKILSNWINILIQTKHEADFPRQETDVTVDPVSDTELTVIHYVAGYIALKLQRFNKRFPENKAAKHALGIINKWRVPAGGSGAIFLSYSIEWTDALDRGGLFRVSESVMLFFRQLESRSRPFVNKQYLSHNPRVNIRDILTSALFNSIPIQTAWDRLTPETDEETRRLILRRVIDSFVPIRIRAYLKALAYINRQKLSKKGEKSLRKTLSGNKK